MELLRNGLKLVAVQGLDDSEGSVNVPVKLVHNSDDQYVNFTEQLHIRYINDGKAFEEILPSKDSEFYIPGKVFVESGPIQLAVHLINGDVERVTNELQFVVKKAPNGKTLVDPSEFSWQQLVDQYVSAKLETFADKADMNEFKNGINANLTNQDKKITDLQTSTKFDLDSQSTKINDITSTQNSKIAILESRMSTFTSLKEGSTTGDAELIDARIGADGTTYPSAGDAMRGQIEQLKEDLGNLSDIIFSDDISSGFYRKGYWDFLGDNDLYLAPNNEFIAEGSNYHYVNDIDYIYVKKPSNIKGRLVVVFNGRLSESTTNEELYIKVPKNVNKFGVYVVSTLPVSDFEGIVIKTAKRIKSIIGLSISKAYSIKDNTSQIIVVDKAGKYGSKTIEEAYLLAKKYASPSNEIEIVIHPGIYNEHNLIPPAYTHTHGLAPNTVVITSEGFSDTLPVFDQRENTKLSNMTIISHTGYCIHYDVNLDGKVIHNENLYLIKVADNNYKDIIGGGGFSHGALFEWVGCTFENGYVNCHTNPYNYQNTHLLFKNCTLSNATIRLGNVGGFGHYVCEIDGLISSEGQLSLTSWTANQRTDVNDKDKIFANSCEWQIIGGSNENFMQLCIQQEKV